MPGARPYALAVGVDRLEETAGRCGTPLLKNFRLRNGVCPSKRDLALRIRAPKIGYKPQLTARNTGLYAALHPTFPMNRTIHV